MVLTKTIYIHHSFFDILLYHFLQHPYCIILLTFLIHKQIISNFELILYSHMTKMTIEEYILTKYTALCNFCPGRRMSRRQLLLLTGQLKKKNYSDYEILRWIHYFDSLNKPVTQRAACKWMCDGVIILPEDEYKVVHAVKVAKLNHVDPLRYTSPMELIYSFAPVRESLTPLDPSTVPTLHFRYHTQKGFDIYDVDESQESRENMRRIINTHFGPDCNPWCLLACDKNGQLTERSGYYWNDYSRYPKRAAFKEGHLIAFSAGTTRHREWWDRMDKSHCDMWWDESPIPNDPLGRKARFEHDGHIGYDELQGGIYRGSKTEGLCERYRSIEATEPYSREFYCNGKRLMQNWKGLTYAKKKELFACSDLESGIFRIPDSFKKIPARAFANAHKLTEIYIPDSVQSLGEYIFEGCTNLRKVRLPSHLTSIPDGLFMGCCSLESIILPDGVTEIGVNAFNGCTRLKTIELPSGVTNIKDRAFSNCTSLSGIIFPEQLESIGKGAFQTCRSIKEIQLPASVMNVGKGAFGGCSITNIVIPETVQSIFVEAFSMCLNLQTIRVCKRWYALFRERYGRKVQLLENKESNLKLCA